MFSLSDLLVQVGRRRRRQRGLQLAAWFLLSLTAVLWVLFSTPILTLASEHLRILLWFVPVAVAALAYVAGTRQRIDIDQLLLQIDQGLNTGERLSSLYEVSLRNGPDVFRYRIEKVLRGKPLPWRSTMPLRRRTSVTLVAAVLLWGGLGSAVTGMWALGSGSAEPGGFPSAVASEREDPRSDEPRSPDAGQEAQRSVEDERSGTEDTVDPARMDAGMLAQVDVDDGSLLAALALLEAFITSETAATAEAEGWGFGQDASRREEALARAQSLLESVQDELVGGGVIPPEDRQEILALAASLASGIEQDTLAAVSDLPSGQGETAGEEAADAGGADEGSGILTDGDAERASEDNEEEQLLAADSSSGDSASDSGSLDETDAGPGQRPLVSALGAPGFVTEKLGGVLTGETAFRDLLTQGIPVEPVYEQDGEAVGSLKIDPLRLQAIVEQRSLSNEQRDLIGAYFRAVTQGGT